MPSPYSCFFFCYKYMIKTFLGGNMNIFILAQGRTGVDWGRSAKYLDNKRINKMAVETAQIMSTVIQEFGIEIPDLDYYKIYKPTHSNHPCVIWAKLNWYNWDALHGYLHKLLHEIARRFNKTPKVSELFPEFTIFRNNSHGAECWPTRTSGITPPPLCMPEEFRGNNLVTSYRRYYASKENIYYDLEDVPEWFVELRSIDTKIRIERNQPYRTVDPFVLRTTVGGR